MPDEENGDLIDSLRDSRIRLAASGGVVRVDCRLDYQASVIPGAGLDGEAT